MNKLTITRGLPASGKTSWALEQVKLFGGFAISRDELRMSMYGKFSGLQDIEERQVSNTERDLVKLHLQFQDVYVHDTCLPDKVCREWRDLAVEAKAEFAIEDLRHVSLEVCLHRNDKRSRVVPKEVIVGMYNRQIKNRNLNAPLAETVTISKELKQYSPDTSKPKAIILDVDGTVADRQTRSPYNTSKYHLDGVHEPIRDIVNSLSRDGYKIVVTSGRDRAFASVTKDWFEANGVVWDDIVMRPEGDIRNDSIVKLELFWEHIAPNYNVIAALDDRKRVVDAWRSIGLTCLQVRPGDF